MSLNAYNPGFKSVGFRDAVVYELDSNGKPKATSTTVPYAGYFLSGPKVFTLNIPTPQVVVHQGRDRVEDTDQLPSKEAATAEIRTSGIDLDVDAFLQGTAKDTIGGMDFVTRMTDKQGSEPQIGVVAWQQSLLRGVRKWHYYFIPSARAIPLNAGMEDQPTDHRYSVNISPMANLPWGIPLTEVDNGSLSAGYVDGYSSYKPLNYPMVSFLADGVEDTFNFSDYKTGRTDYAVVVDGVLRTSNITKSDGEFVFTSAIPTTGKIITVFLV